MNLVETLKTKYRSIDPIFDTDIYALGYTDTDIEESLKENVFEEVKVDDSLGVRCKIYTLVDYDELFDMYTKVNSKDEQIVIKYYIGENYEYGYFTGFSSLNKIGYSNQICAVYEIKSTKAKEKLEVSIGNFKYIIDVVNNNLDNTKFKEYMYINAFNNFRKAFDISINAAINKMKNNKELDLQFIMERIQ